MLRYNTHHLKQVAIGKVVNKGPITNIEAKITAAKGGQTRINLLIEYINGYLSRSQPFVIKYLPAKS